MDSFMVVIWEGSFNIHGHRLDSALRMHSIQFNGSRSTHGKGSVSRGGVLFIG